MLALHLGRIYIYFSLLCFRCLLRLNTLLVPPPPKTKSARLLGLFFRLCFPRLFVAVVVVVVVVVVVFVVVVLTLTRIIKSVVTGQAPVTLEPKNTLGKKTQTKSKVCTGPQVPKEPALVAAETY